MAYAPGAGRRSTPDVRRQSSADLEDQRRALETAGREEWERATREGRDVQARTTDELRALGARVLARAAGAQHGANRWERASARSGDRVVVTAQEDQADDALERREIQANVELNPNLNDIANAAAGKRIYMRPLRPGGTRRALPARTPEPRPGCGTLVRSTREIGEPRPVTSRLLTSSLPRMVITHWRRRREK